MGESAYPLGSKVEIVVDLLGVRDVSSGVEPCHASRGEVKDAAKA